MEEEEEEEQAFRRERCLAPEKRGGNYQNERLYTARILSSAVSIVTGSCPLPLLFVCSTIKQEGFHRSKEGQRRSADSLKLPSPRLYHTWKQPQIQHRAKLHLMVAMATSHPRSAALQTQQETD